MPATQATATQPDRAGAPPAERLAGVYATLEAGWRHLRDHPDDIDIRNAVLAGYAKLGLAELAIEAAVGFPPEIRGHQDVVSAMATLRALPKARVEWSSLAAQFDRNLSVLERHCPETAALREVCRSGALEAFELYRAIDGNYQICRRDEAGFPVWVPRIGDHRREAEQFKLPEAKSLLPSPYIFEGMEAHHIFEPVCRQTYHTYVTYSPAIYVVEPNAAWLAAVLHLHDWREVLAHGRPFFFAGPDAVVRFRDFLLSHEQLPIPSERIHYTQSSEGLARSLAEVLLLVRTRRYVEASRLSRDVARLYANRGPRALAERFNNPDPENPLRVMFLVSRYTTVMQYTIRDLADGFRAAGYPTEIVKEETDCGALTPESRMRRILEFKPDLVVIPNHIRAEYLDLTPPQIVVATWIQDPMHGLFRAITGRAVRTRCCEPGEPGVTAPTDYVFGYFRRDLVGRYGYPADTFLSYPIIPANPNLYRPVEVTPELERRYGCELAFLSNGNDPCERSLAKLLETFEPPVRPLVEAAFETIRDHYRRGGDLLCYPGSAAHSQLKKVADRLATEMKIDPALVADFDQRFRLLNDKLWRHATLEWMVALGIDLHLHGRGWEEPPTFARFARPPVNDPAEIAAVYGCAKTSLQIGAYGALHQRMITGLFCGGFFIARESSYNYGAFDYRHPELQDGPSTPDERRAALDALAELSRRGCDSFEDFTAPGNRELVEVIAPVAGEPLPAADRNDVAALWETVSLLLRVVPRAVFPECWDDVAFWSREEMADRLDRFIRREPERRKELATYMRRQCLDKHGPEPLVRRLLGHIGRCLAKSVGGEAAPPPASSGASGGGRQGRRPARKRRSR